MKFFSRPLFPTTTAGRLFSCFLMGCVGGSAMGPLYLWPALMVALGIFWILLTDLSRQAKWKSFLAGWLFGFGYFVFSLYWIGNALLVDGNPYIWAYPLAVAGLPALFSFYPALAAFIARTLRGGRSLPAFLVYLVSMMLFEYLRGRLFTGFPWNLFGMAWTGNLPMLQFLSIGGVYALSFLTIFMFSVPAFAWKGESPKIIRYGFLVAAVALGCGLYMFGVQRLASHPTTYHDNVVVQIIQPDIAQADKWNGEKMWDNYRDLLSVIRADATLAPKGENPVRVLVLPETAITYHHLETPQAMDALRGAMIHFREQTYVLTGALLKDAEGYHNSLIALNQDAKQIYSFDKFHLVPFGEYIPFQKYVPFGPIVNFSGFVEGIGPQTVSLDGVPPFSPLVCYEIIFPGEVTSDNPKRPEWIVNVTNDAWYGISAGPFQHLAQAIYRAIEEGVPVVRSANTGISAVIDPYGRLVTLTPLMSLYSVETLLPRAIEKQPFYSQLKTY